MGVIIKNGIAYTGANILKQPIIYSTDEREVGVWIDGKPLYQKTIITTNTTVNSWQNVDISSLNIESVASMNGYWVRHSSIDTYLTYPFFALENDSNTYTGLFRIDPGDGGPDNSRLRYKITSDGTSKQVFTIQYTKTTDVAGSGTWTPSGIPAVHYDSNEKVIGTWFGETLYEKTIVTDFLNSSASNVLRQLSINITNLDDIKNIDGFWKIEDYGNVIPINLYHTSEYRTVMQIYPDGNIIGYMFSWGTTRGKLYLTLRYTKTT